MKRWFVRGVLATVIAAVALCVAAAIVARRLDPNFRKWTVAYLEERFDSDVEAGAIRVRVPPLAWLRLLLPAGRGRLVTLEGDHIVLRPRGQGGLPPLFVLRHFTARLGLGTVFARPMTVQQVALDGMEINVPPKGQRRSLGRRGPGSQVVIQEVLVRDAVLNILPKQPGKAPLHFELRNIRLESAGRNVAMKYQVALVNAKPPGEIRSSGTFGPWAEGDPGDTPMAGSYLFEKADLGVFRGIAGILRSTGRFEGTLSSFTARGEASVPDFRLTSAGNPVPLATRFEVLVDGTNGNTELKPVKARLGSTHFVTTGAIIRYEGESRRTIALEASMPQGNLRDVLRLAMKGTPIMEGVIRLNTKIVIPPLSGKVKEKLVLDGSFDVTRGRFLRLKVQDKIDELSSRGQGAPGNQDIREAVHRMSGKYHLSGGHLEFQRLAFAVPGAVINVNGVFDMETTKLDFRGVLMLRAKVSQTMKGWKRWLLKPLDPFLANHGAGTYLHIKLEGTSEDLQFGLDPGGSDRGE